MRITLRLILSLVVATSAIVFVSAGYQARQEEIRLQEELDKRATVLAVGLRDAIEPVIAGERKAGLQRLVEKFGNRERLAGVAVYSKDGPPLAVTSSLPPEFHTLPAAVREAELSGEGRTVLVKEGQRRWHLHALPVHGGEGPEAILLLVHDAGYIRARAGKVWRENFLRLFFHVLVIALITLLIVRWSLLQPLAKTVDWMKRIRAGEPVGQIALPQEDLFGPLTREVTHLAANLVEARAAVEEEARLRLAVESRWTPERLKEHVRSVLQGRSLLVVANREPYEHVRVGGQIQCRIPASGLVTAVEPILRACSGTWVAHGSGDADHETADAQGKLKVPPESPFYTLKRVWLTKEEEDGYYYGFANEGLWPLCHTAHTRPLFRAGDWTQYRRVNEKFAESVLEELEGTGNPCVLIQDYHFALLPRLIKARRPDARVALFWHIPWPNPEAFGICPQARELLDGMLGADILGFHIQFHCNNFLDTVDRLVECRIDWERFAVNRGGQNTLVKPFPISIAMDEGGASLSKSTEPSALRENLCNELGVTAQYLGIGVDRIDYTKGIGERFLAVERFLEKHPEFQGKFTFVEIGAPSRTLIQRYHSLGAELDSEADRINRRFQTRTWKPIVYLKRHHSHAEIGPFYQASAEGRLHRGQERQRLDPPSARERDEPHRRGEAPAGFRRQRERPAQRLAHRAPHRGIQRQRQRDPRSCRTALTSTPRPAEAARRSTSPRNGITRSSSRRFARVARPMPAEARSQPEAAVVVAVEVAAEARAATAFAPKTTTTLAAAKMRSGTRNGFSKRSASATRV